MLPGIREKLGDAKDAVREKTQVLIQQIMQDTVTSPQVRRKEEEGGRERKREGERERGGREKEGGRERGRRGEEGIQGREGKGQNRVMDSWTYVHV